MKRKNLPNSAGVYKFLDEKGKIIYIGKAKNLKSRLASYFGQNLSPKTARMVRQAKSLSYIKTFSDFEAILLEAELVRKYKPFYNIQLKDDKTPIYIVITKEEYPRVITLRKSQLAQIKSLRTFGPYTSGNTVRKVLKYIRRIYPFSQHKLGNRACIYHQMGLCDPCPSVIAKINNEEIRENQRKRYLKNISKIRKVLTGNLKAIRNELEKEMKKYSKDKKFEDAQKMLKKIEMFDYITAPTTSISQYVDNPNLSQDIREEELTTFKNILQGYLPVKKLKRIECFDIAHLAGTNPTASMVVFTDAEADRKYWRHFKIYNAKKADDYSAMQEVLKRRVTHFKDWGQPDLIIVDGGKGQVTAALQVLPETVPIVGLAKRFETLIIKTPDKFISLRLPDGPAKNLVVRLRDEAHRFARRLHHKQVAKTLQRNR